MVQRDGVLRLADAAKLMVKLPLRQRVDAGDPGRLSADVRRWRRVVLRRAGFGEDLAWSLARDGRVDLHELLTLVDRGCPPELAARILKPL